MRADEIMTTPVHTVHPHTSLKAVAELLTTRRIGAAPVVNTEGTLVGIRCRTMPGKATTARLPPRRVS
jgi:CBS domain-containing protein